jgi:hypothetical protein
VSRNQKKKAEKRRREEEEKSRRSRRMEIATWLALIVATVGVVIAATQRQVDERYVDKPNRIPNNLETTTNPVKIEKPPAPSTAPSNLTISPNEPSGAPNLLTIS